jgi:branched-chain amino acid transport system ATP-binding protein
MGAYLRSDGSIGEDIDRVFTLFPRLKERRTQVAGTLSGGEQQMLAIGRALLARPKLLIMDEPSMGLSPLYVEKTFDIIQDLFRQGIAVLLVEQNANMALQVAHYAYVMENGKIVMEGTAKELSENPDVKEFYLGMAASGVAKSYKDVKSYRRRKRWL